MEGLHQRSRAEIFLKLYRILEGMLEKRYTGRRKGPSVVMQYLADSDSEDVRADLDICREIRNILSHNADDEGNALIEPSDAVMEMLSRILRHVSKPYLATELAVPKEKILGAHGGDRIIDIMHAMASRGFSHVPVLERGRVIGVFSSSALFMHMERCGLNALNEDARISELKDALRLDRYGVEKYRFMPDTATAAEVRAAFENEIGRKNRLSAVFLTDTGTGDGALTAMLTHWDVLKVVDDP